MKSLVFLKLFLIISMYGTTQSFIEFTYPNIGETLEVNTVDSIKWKSTNVDNVKIEYCRFFNNYPGPNEWVEIDNNINANSGYYLWNIPDTLNTPIRLKISDSSDSLVYDLSDANVNFWNPITTPKNIRIISPNGGEILEASTDYFNISVKGQNVSFIDFEYSIDNGLNWIKIDTLIYNQNIIVDNFFIFYQTFNWPIPNANSTQCKIRVIDKTNNSIFDESDEVFTITENAQKKIEVVYPNEAYTQLPIDSIRTISWNSTGISNVKIEYATDYNISYDTTDYIWETILESTPAHTGNYDWQVPSTLLTASRIRISDANNTSIYDISDSNFSTYNAENNPPIPFELVLTSLNGGEILEASSDYFNIAFKTKGNAFDIKPDFQLSTDNGNNWISINNELSYNSTTYEPDILILIFKSANWGIPNTNSTQCKIRIVDLNDNSVIDESNNVFSITDEPTKSLELISPNGGQLACNSENDIIWISEGVSNVKIEFTANFNRDFDNPNIWTTIVESTPAIDGYYTWQVPDSIITYGRIRISDVSASNIYEFSDTDISTYDPITTPKDLIVVTPNGGETLLGGSAYNNITWMSSNIFNNVIIEYTIDNGQSWQEISSYIVTFSQSNPHQELSWVNSSWFSINWVVPNVNSTQCKIRITDIWDNSITDESDEVFTIVEDTTITHNIVKENNCKIELFPNPSKDLIYLKASDNIISYNIYNSQGVCVNKKTSINKKLFTIDLASFKAGIYIIQILTNKGIVNKKIMKIK